MKKITAIILALMLFMSTFIVVNAEPEDVSEVLSEKLTEIFSELESSENEPVSETETTTKTPETTTKEPETTTKAPETTTKAPETTTAEPVTHTPLPSGYYKGDINKDGYITAADARQVLQFSSKLMLLTEQQCVLADIDSNKSVNAQDARLTLRMAAKLDSIKPSPDAQNASSSNYLDKYGNNAIYKPYLSDFSTNITDETLFPLIKELENLCSQYGSVVTFYFTDVNQEYYIQYKSNYLFRTQCTIKAPFIKSALV